MEPYPDPDPRFKAVYERILETAGVTTQVELAEILGIKQSKISDAKRRQKIPATWLICLAVTHAADPFFLLGKKDGSVLDLIY